MQCPTCKNEVDESQRFCPGCGTVLPPPAEQAADPMIGQVMGGKYRVVRLLGEGGMGAVYEGEQQLGTTKRKVAVKTLHPHLSRDEKVKARFEREVGTIAELEHPNTIQVYDFGATPDGILYIVMEFLQGKSLADLLEKGGAMPFERVAYIMEQVCGSLEEAHNRGIVHRDLKPDNVVLVERAGKKDFVKVLDFGIAKRSKEEDKNEQKLTQQGMVLGTPPYMSPEQFTGRPIDARSDIYSLAVMAYEMLTGTLPFRAETAWEWATQHMTQPPIPMESTPEGARVPPGMRSAVHRSLAKSPDERFQKVQDFNAAFTSGTGVAIRSGTAPLPASQGTPGRQRTEVGEPLDVAAAFAPTGLIVTPAPMMSPMGVPAGGPGPVGAYTPAQGNVAYPTPAGIPQAPTQQTGGGGGRTALLISAGVVGVASVVAIVFALRGSTPKPVTFPTTVPPATPTTVLTPTKPTPPPTVPGTGPDVPPLVPNAVPHPTVSAPKKYDGPDCERARTLRKLGHPKDAETWAVSCIRNGGNPN